MKVEFGDLPGGQKRVVWDLSREGKVLVNGAVACPNDVMDSRDSRDMALMTGIEDASRSLVGMLETEGLVGSSLVIRVPSSRIESMLSDYRPWGRASKARLKLGSVMLKALDKIPMKMSAVCSRNNEVSSGKSRRDTFLSDSPLEFDD